MAREKKHRFKQPDGHLPELLSVSCGYFTSIIRQLLMRQRKTMIKYILHTTKGQAFDRLVSYSQYHSLTDLLVELMQINVVYEPPKSNDQTRVSTEEREEESGEKSEERSEQQKPESGGGSQMQMEMKVILEGKKREVIKKLITQLSHKNRDDLEVSLNAHAVLIELIETEKTLGVFLENDG
jgi:hypothetical protein